MKIQLRQGLPFITVSITHQGQSIEIENVLIDTGSAGTVFSVERLFPINLEFGMDEKVTRIYGVGGSEFVFTKQVDCLILGEIKVNHFEIEVGAMDYGFEIDGILGMDFLSHIGAIIDLANLEVRLTTH